MQYAHFIYFYLIDYMYIIKTTFYINRQNPAQKGVQSSYNNIIRPNTNDTPKTNLQIVITLQFNNRLLSVRATFIIWKTLCVPSFCNKLEFC